MPGDKSISHRAVILSSLADGRSRLTGLADGADVLRTVAAMCSLGAQIAQDADGAWVIEGRGMTLTPPPGPIDCGNSGTTMRLLAGVLAGQQFESVLVGDESLSRRPMGRIAAPLERMGADVAGATAPLTVRGRRPLSSLQYESPRASAQVKSAVLLAGLYAQGRTAVIEPHDSRDHTELMLTARGVPVIDKGLSGPVGRIEPRDEIIEADPSSAAFALCAAAVMPGADVAAPGLCLSPTRTGFLDVLRALGATVADDGAVQAAIDPAPVVIDGELTVRCLDELPVLAVILSRLPGRSEIRDAAELRVKESDRLESTAALLRAAGVGVDERPSGLVINGDPTRPLRAFRFDAPHDHRLVMAAAVAALMADGPCEVTPAQATATSYPAFWTHLEELAQR